MPKTTALQLHRVKSRLRLLNQEILMYQRVMEGMRDDLGIEGLLKLIVDSVREGLGFKRAGVFLLGPDGKTIRLAMGIDKTGRRYETGRTDYAVSDKKGADIFSDMVNGYRKFFLTNNLPKRFPGHVRRYERPILNNAGVPIQLGRDRVIGILAVDNLHIQRVITPGDVSSLLNYATQVGLSIESFRTHQRALAQSVTDPLTGLYNRRFFEQALDQELKRCRRYARSFSLILADLDHFKRVNDTHGHDAGDAVLSKVAEIIRGNLRSLDLVARIGGEEFAILLPETPPRNITTVTRRLLKAVRESAYPLPGGNRVDMTISLGVTSYMRGNVAPNQLMKQADRSLYQAKRAGRDRCGPMKLPPG